MEQQTISSKIIRWYKENARDLPWRNTSDPYKIWLSEIILQQTRVNQGLPYYNRFVERFPTVKQLAEAEEQEVLRLWQGLGYYSRARNLHRCANEILEFHQGIFPKTYKKLLNLPGIGKYTAAAIASFAFEEPVPAIDGNVFRVLSRIFGVYDDILPAKNRKIFEGIASELIPQDNPALYNQAMMEFGAQQCKPKSPLCETCPVAVECFARKNNEQNKLPVKLKKVKVKRRAFTYLVLESDDKVMMMKRKKGDIWQGLFDYPLLETENISEIDLKNKLQALGITSDFEILSESETFKHILSHQVINAKFIHIKLSSVLTGLAAEPEEAMNFYSPEEVDDLPKPVLVSNYLNQADF